jgi:hypothetical protein
MTHSKEETMGDTSITRVRSADIKYEPLMLSLSKAQAMAYVLERLGAPDGNNDLVHALNGDDVPDCTHDWLHSIAGDALRAALDEIELEYRKLRAGAPGAA